MVLLKKLANLWYSKGTLERSGASVSFVKLVWMSKEWRQSSKLLEFGSFDVCKNATVLIIVMLSYSEIDIEVSDVGMETMESNDCREVSRDNRDANSMLAVTWERARFSYKNGQKFINLFT